MWRWVALSPLRGLLAVQRAFPVHASLHPPKPKEGLGGAPGKDEPQQGDGRTVVVQIMQGEAGEMEVKVNRESVSLQNLKARLADIFKTRAEKVLFVEADRGLDWSSVVEVIAIAHQSGIDNIGLMTAKIAETS